LVTAPGADGLRVAGWFLDNLGRRGGGLDGVIVNRMAPVDTEVAAEQLLELPPGPLRENLSDLLAMADAEAALIADLRTDAASQLGQPEGSITVTTLAEQQRPVSDLDGLADLAGLLAQ
jgi:hypothetical protein